MNNEQNALEGEVIEAVIKWVKASERLPLVWDDYLVTSGHWVGSCHYDGKFYDYSVHKMKESSRFEIPVTYWAKLPPPPDGTLKQQSQELLDCLKEIEKWSLVYQFQFQFWGEGNNNVFIYKDDVELASFGGEETIKDIMKLTIEWVNKVNPKGYKAK